MSWSFDIRCDKCHSEQRDFESLVFRQAYILRDGQHVLLPYQIAWCRTCEKVVRSELSVGELRRFADEWEARGNLWEREEFRAKHRRGGERLRAVVADRHSGPRCLTCGSTEILGLGDWDWRRGYVHPNCDGRLTFTAAVHRNILGSLIMWSAYNTEGEDLDYQVESDVSGTAPEKDQ
jgi:hypothetical protein